MAKRVVCFGPGPKFKGGISNYNTSLAKAFDKRGCETHIVSWTQQYPAIIPREFIDKSSRTDLLEGTNVQVKYITNYNKPATWKQTAKFIANLNPDKVIIQWSIAVQGLPIGSMVKQLKKLGVKEVILDLHFVVQKENSTLDQKLTKRGIKNADNYVVHALKTANELKTLFPNKQFHITEEGDRVAGLQNIIKLYHPVYDLFQHDPNFDKEAFKAKHGLKKHVFLFFGFIRKYKGLHQAIEAFAALAEKRDDVSLVICGESFWNTLDSSKWSTKIKQALFGTAKKLFLKKEDDEQNYNPLTLIDELNLGDKTLVVNEFVANEDVPQYFQVSDAVLLFYLYATPSGVESLSYNFDMPILATNVGHFPETITDGFNGYLAKDRDVADMTRVMEAFLEKPIDRKNVAKTTEKMSWDNYAKAILK
jgi:glycosyltransferase involved in cell wall biosynthesis